jgi:hypothetical protein
MFEILVWATAVICLGAMLHARLIYKDPFHPALIILPMFAFIYVVMPMFQARQGDLFTYVSEDRLVWVQSIVITGLLSLVWGISRGSAPGKVSTETVRPVNYDAGVLHRGAFVLGFIGLGAWVYTVQNSGGVTAVFGHSKGCFWQLYLAHFGIIIWPTPGLMFAARILGFRPHREGPAVEAVGMWKARRVCGVSKAVGEAGSLPLAFRFFHQPVISTASALFRSFFPFLPLVERPPEPIRLLPCFQDVRPVSDAVQQCLA